MVWSNAIYRYVLPFWRTFPYAINLRSLTQHHLLRIKFSNSSSFPSLGFFFIFWQSLLCWNRFEVFPRIRYERVKQLWIGDGYFNKANGSYGSRARNSLNNDSKDKSRNKGDSFSRYFDRNLMPVCSHLCFSLWCFFIICGLLFALFSSYLQASLVLRVSSVPIQTLVKEALCKRNVIKYATALDWLDYKVWCVHTQT